MPNAPMQTLASHELSKCIKALKNVGVNKIYVSKLKKKSFVKDIQSNFNGSNTFGTMKISSRQGEFKPMRVDYSVKSGGLIVISF